MESRAGFGIQVAALADMVCHRDRTAYSELGGVDGIADKVRCNLKTGLTSTEADDGFTARRAQFGINRYPEPPKKSFISLWLDALKDTTMIILIVSSLVSIVVGAAVPHNFGKAYECAASSEAPAAHTVELGEWVEGLVILLAVLIVSTVTAGNNYSKELKFRALAAKEQDVLIKVRRDGHVASISIFDLNVGDICLLDTGDQIPGDGLYVQGYDLRCDESQMTGEPEAVKKSREKDPFLLSGCKVTDGSGQYLVTAVGPNSEWGKTLASLGDKSRPTPLQENLDEMAGMIGKIGMSVAVLVFVVLVLWWLIPALTYECQYACVGADNKPDPCIALPPGNFSTWNATDQIRCKCRSYDWSQATQIVSFLIIGITIVVVAVPEGLPLAVTISLAYSMKQMYADNNLVRHLKACETMSNCTNICSDKTGTLTENRMTVVRGWIAGQIFDSVPPKFAVQRDVMRLLSEGISINTSPTSSFTREEGKGVVTVGNKTECALLIFLDALGLNYQELRNTLSDLIFQRFTFSSARKRMNTLIWLDRGAQTTRMHCKGAPEVLLRRSLYFMDRESRVMPLDAATRENLLAMINEWSASGLRTLCLAYRDIKVPESGAERVQVQTLGVEGIPVPSQAASSSAPAAAGAGAGAAAPATEAAGGAAEPEGGDNSPIEVVADSPDGAPKFVEAPDAHMIVYAFVGIQDPVREEVPEAVLSCQAAGITVRMVTGDNLSTAKCIAKECHIYDEKAGLAIEGPAFAKMSDQDVDQILPNLQIIARCAPTDKQRLVRRLIEKGEVVAVTGDGTNDVPALKEADIGLSMGLRGTDIAKQASDIVILDDNFKSIVRSVMWGRNVYDNIRKFLQFQLTVNVVALFIVFIGAISQRGAPLKAIQLLWVNMIMDTLAALALGTEKPTEALLKRRPFGRYDRLISNYMMRNILLQGLYQMAVLLVLLYAASKFQWLDIPCAYAKKTYFTAVTPCRLWNGAIPTNALIDEHTVILQTIIFNTFVFCQVFNEINSRKVNNEWNVWEGIYKNWMFLVIMVIIVGFQTMLIIVSGPVMGVEPMPGINWKAWLTCIFVALFTLPLGLVSTLIPVPKQKPRKFKPADGKCFGLCKGNKDETTDAREDA
jgi:Ca2+-transporting ATPase